LQNFTAAYRQKREPIPYCKRSRYTPKTYNVCSTRLHFSKLPQAVLCESKRELGTGAETALKQGFQKLPHR